MSIKSTIKNKLHSLNKSIETRDHKLSYIFLEITRKCNLNCLHCGSDCRADSNFPELTTKSWFKIIDYFEKTYSSSVAFIITGGEPLLHPEIYKIGQYIDNKGMRWGMVTNGISLTNSNLNKLIESGIHSITLSLDGLEDSHNWLRNSPNAFGKTISALKEIAKSNIHFKDVVTCVSPKNLNELCEIANLLIKNNIENWRLFRIFPSGRAKENVDLNLSFEQTQKMIDFIAKHKKTFSKKSLNVNLSCEGWISFDKDIQVRDNPFFCRAGINIASVLSDGTITGCTNNSEAFHVGNIINDNFAKLWVSNFDIFRKREWLKDTECSKCKNIKQCNGSSIHLWDGTEDKQPKFCYEIDLNKEKIL